MYYIHADGVTHSFHCQWTARSAFRRLSRRAIREGGTVAFLHNEELLVRVTIPALIDDAFEIASRAVGGNIFAGP
jgi:hypothetical protein